jgi:hypothetical protein
MSASTAITVDVDPEFFLFARGEKELKQATYLNLQKKGESYLPLRIGEGGEIPGSILCPLFSNEGQLAPDLDKFDALVAFIAYAVEQLGGSQILPINRPILVFRGADKLQRQLGGYQRYLLSAAATLAGARKVIFE